MNNISHNQHSQNQNEIEPLLKRAEKLSATELKELTELVGIKFEGPENEVLTKDDYLRVLDEADSFEKVDQYLKQKGL